MSSKTILVTGSSRGIGRAVAELAHKQGYKVIVHGHKQSKQLDEVHASLNGSEKVVFDVADKESVKKTMDGLLHKVGNVDVLVNNAGVVKNIVSNVQDVSDESAIEEYKVNVLGSIHCTQAVLPGMQKKGKGSIVNISSIKGVPNLSTMSTLTYATTKAGVISLTKSLAKTYAADGIRVNSVCPGYTETDQVKLWNKETFDRINNGTLLGRMAKPQEIASIIMYLASDEASYITGSDFLADGGYSIKGK